MITDVTDLEVYKESLNLLKEVQNLVNLIPTAEKDLVWQVKRASRSIPANIIQKALQKDLQQKSLKDI